MYTYCDGLNSSVTFGNGIRFHVLLNKWWIIFNFIRGSIVLPGEGGNNLIAKPWLAAHPIVKLNTIRKHLVFKAPYTNSLGEIFQQGLLLIWQVYGKGLSCEKWVKQWVKWSRCSLSDSAMDFLCNCRSSFNLCFSFPSVKRCPYTSFLWRGVEV